MRASRERGGHSFRRETTHAGGSRGRGHTQLRKSEDGGQRGGGVGWGGRGRGRGKGEGLKSGWKAPVHQQQGCHP